MNCEKCGCPYSTSTGFRTCDGYSAWQDTDGTWYKGPAREEWTKVCDGCGRKEVTVKQRGKLVSRTVAE